MPLKELRDVCHYCVTVVTIGAFQIKGLNFSQMLVMDVMVF